MSETYNPSRPLLRPVLTLRKTPAKKQGQGGGKKATDIVASRLDGQRTKLAQQVRSLRASASNLRAFNGTFLLVAEMFDDSFATTKTPRDLFRFSGQSMLKGPAADGYLIEMKVGALEALERRIRDNGAVAVKCDISRVKSLRPFGEKDIVRNRTISDLWEAAPEEDDGRAFFIWLSPFRDVDARGALLREVRTLEEEGELVSTSSRILVRDDADGSGVLTTDATERQSSISVAQRDYRASGHGRALVEVPSEAALRKIVASGGVFRIEPVKPFVVTSPGEGTEPSIALPSDIGLQPIVAVIDGGFNARRYGAAEAWREVPFVPDGVANTKHGNQVGATAIHGHAWNNNLWLPELHCRIGIAQVIPRNDSGHRVNPARFISYLDQVIARHPDTKVWNFSWNEAEAADPIYVSQLGHDLSVLARKHGVLFVISAGNVSNTIGDRIAPPADCEAALVVGGRNHDRDGRPGEACSDSLPGYGPEYQLAPHVTSFSPLRLLGGVIQTGTSFAAPLVSALAAHTFENLRDPSPDLVRALIVNRTDLPEFDRQLGWGTACAENMPWTCAPGTVTLAFRASLKAGQLYYWEDIPIPRELIRNGKFCGHVSLTSVHQPLCSETGGPSYVATRVAAAVQYPNSAGNYTKLVGSKELDDTPELEARAEEYKWQPLRRECRDFTKRGGLAFNGGALRIYARAFGRNISQFDYTANEDIPEIEAAFVVTFSDGSSSGQLYDSVTNSLGNFVESAVIDQDIEIET